MTLGQRKMLAEADALAVHGVGRVKCSGSARAQMAKRLEGMGMGTVHTTSHGVVFFEINANGRANAVLREAVR